MDKIFNKRNLIIAGVLILVVIYFVVNSFFGRLDIKRTDLEIVSGNSSQEGYKDYNSFLTNNEGLDFEKAEYRIPLIDNGSEYKLIKSKEKYDVAFNVAQTGLYCMKVEYCTLDDNLYDYDLSIMVNGEYQYSELKNIQLKNSWIIDQENSNGITSPYFLKDRGNLVQNLYDRNFYYDTPLKIKLVEGENIVSIVAGDYDLTVFSITFYTEEDVPSYDEYKKTLTHNEGELIYLEAEYADIRNNASIQEQTDTSSVDTTPESFTLGKVNTIGGSSFANIGDEITWLVDVKESGTYTFNMRVRQNYNSGSVVYRSLFVDDKILFDECRSLEIPYESGWQNFTFKNEDAPYLFDLPKGEHKITLKVTYGDNSQVINKMSRVLEDLNTSYRKIMMLVSPNPDPYRDYLIDKKIPDVLENLKKTKTEIANVSDYITWISGVRGSETSVLDTMVRQLEYFEEEPNDIPAQLATFKNNISAIGTWITDKKSQPLEIDNIELIPENSEPQKQTSNFLKQLGFNCSKFISSFTSDYTLTGDNTEKKNVEVWTTVGRQQVDVIERLIDEDFSKQSDVNVELKLVSGGTLIPAVVAGIGPDVSIMEGNGNAINFAVRKAVKDISVFEDFDELYNQFDPEAFVPVSYGGKVYAVPEQRTFPVMFYRKDILDELNLEVPNTWDELYSMMFKLQKNNMEVGISADIGTFTMFLYQYGGTLYDENATKTELLSDASIRSFKQWTKYFSDFGLPLTFNFVNRFSSGEMPIAIADYTAYNTLIVFAPEIYDLWDIALVPGTVQEDGSINRSVTSGGSCAMIFEDTKDENSAWEFVKWWTGADAQQAYARNIEIKMGASARYPVANSIAFDNMMWTERQIDILKKQMEHVKGIPEIPGSYFTGRHINNAFRKVVYNGADVKETLMEYSEVIDLEIEEKRKELKLD